MSTRRVRAGRRTVEIHRPEKVLFPGPGLTKAGLVDYYRSVASFMLPELRGRPLMLERHPDGLGGPQFMQKHTPASYPDWIRRAELAKKGGTVTHPVCDDTATLVYLADQACLTFHRWQSRADRPDFPDRLVFDLDPAEDDFETVRRAAELLGELLGELRLPSALLTTGSRGLHVIVPLDGRTGFDEVRDFASEVARTLAARDPDRLTTEVRTAARGGRLYLDVQRNAYAQTAVAPFSVRAREEAPVATPMSWDQLKDPEITARRWTVTNVLEQARTRPWAGVPRRGRALGPARRRLAALRGAGETRG
ncbi:non-homologous end-joining DNA ligase [Streptomyces sp. AK02-01A]|uniref:non-homologous end-joining DNA ligase n=1 Tax=Streptomyces sp. AK02-01A TaxID=3028648 RepID=UPI0029BDE4FA|nr:non-homologous end-joining DNA ligase [Streptomyces sp. AK02-01A]MDX3854298.1 non-homologous end-joining DNA ligase [Streptomyces sp. AK02-01A]